MAMPGCPPLPLVLLLRKLICFSSAVLACVILAHGQPQEGFISIDCGIPDGPGYRDEFTTIFFSPDAQYIDAGESKNVTDLGTENLRVQYQNLRSFPTGRRNCYRLWPVLREGKYLIRAAFLYGNYDGNNSVPEFDLHIGVNFWTTVSLSSPDGGGTEEIITVAQADSIWVCLVNTGKGTPFISYLELRPLLPFMYERANASHSLVLLDGRRDYGSTQQLRYNKDPYDRIWFNYTGDLTSLNSKAEVTISAGDRFQVPSSVLRTAATTVIVSDHINIRRASSPGDTIYVVMHFAEVELPNETTSRLMDIYEGIDGSGRLLYANYSPPYLQADAREAIATTGNDGTYNLSIYASDSSSRPLAIGATESFIIRLMNVSVTDHSDVDAMEDIKKVYQVKMNWMGDPCAPEEFVWDGLNCSYESSNPPRITHLNLTSGGLSDGGISASIANLTALTTLDLSNNNLTGAIPSFLAELPSLKLLVLTGNQFRGTIPHDLCGKVQDATVSIRIEGYPDQCAQVTDKKKTFMLVAIIASVTVLLLIVISIVLWRIKRGRHELGASKDLSKKQREELALARNITKDNEGLKRESYHFTFSDIKNITNNFEMAIGRGGFGIVYLGQLNDGIRVAVKVLSESSSQGMKEFEAEVLLLTRVHHRNLLSLLGYCDDENNIALVYEYLDQGTLKDHLSDKIDNMNVLSWEQRIKIALQAAQGLDYLHNGCKPPIVHRDVKSTNILLNHASVAKVADFGLSRAFNSENHSHISTKVAGTPGYLAPEYYKTYRLDEKSDVYSFGIVLLEIITGKPPFPNETAGKKTHIVQWVQSRLDCGYISSIIDARLNGEYDTNSAWKVVEIAMLCTSKVSAQRLTMDKVVSQLKECLSPEVALDVFDDFEVQPNSNSFETLPLRINSGIIPSAR